MKYYIINLTKKTFFLRIFLTKFTKKQNEIYSFKATYDGQLQTFDNELLEKRLVSRQQ